MDHAYYRDKVSAYYDRQLPPQEAEVIRQHLEACEECRRLLVELECLDKLVEERSHLADREYWEQSARKIEDRLGFGKETKVVDVRRSAWSGLGPKLAAAAAVLVLTFVVIYQGDIRRTVFEEPAEKQAAPVIEDTTQAIRALEQPSDPAVAEEMKHAAPKADYPDKEAVEKKAVLQEDISTTVTTDTQTPAGRGTVAFHAASVGKPSESMQVDVAEMDDALKTASVRQEAKQIQRPPVQEASEAGIIAPAESLPESLPEDWLLPASLDVWRQRRDSLQTVLAEMTSPHAPLAQVKARTEAAKTNAADVQGLLVYAWYEVARVTDNQSEREAALEYLRDIAASADSSLKALAGSYLKLLEPQDD
ncbi:MAG: zf-HC2 domain-containing protein [Candidatus Zixiibacteriota bacterium]